ncbi:MAG: glycosyltransferase [Hyphomicrobiaceae bacterium]|jgi:Glycosyltransferase
MRVVQFLIGSYGGAERFFIRLCSALAARGVEQLLLINDHPALVGDVQRTGLRYEIFVPSRLGGIVDRYRVAKLCKAFHADIVMAWMNRAARRLPRGNHVNVGRLGGYYPVKNYRRCDYLIGNTPGIVEKCIADGWPADRIRMISNFTEPFEETGGPINDFGIEPGRPVICALGRFDPWKGFDTLIQALVRVENAVLLLAGQGEGESTLRVLAERCGVTDRVRFLGWLDDRASLFRRADICVVPSHHEPLGNVILEAWSAGCPVVAAASEGPSWLIESGRTGMLVPPSDPEALANALNAALAAPEMKKQWAEEGRRRWEREFTVEQVCAHYLSFLSKIEGERISCSSKRTSRDHLASI